MCVAWNELTHGGGVDCVGQVAYAFGYQVSPRYRLAGQIIYYPGFIGWIWGLYTAAMALRNGTPF